MMKKQSSKNMKIRKMMITMKTTLRQDLRRMQTREAAVMKAAGVEVSFRLTLCDRAP